MTLDTEIQLLATQRGEAGNADTYRRYDTELTFVDGVAQLSMGPAMVRLDLYQTRAVQEIEGNSVEIREVERTIVMPTIAFVELVANTFETSINNTALLEGALKGAFSRLEDIVQRIKNKS